MEYQIKVTKEKPGGKDRFSQLVEKAYYETGHPEWADKKGMTFEGLKQTPLEDLIYKLGQAIRYAVLTNQSYIRVEVNQRVLPEHKLGQFVGDFFGIHAVNIPDDQECQVIVGER